LRFLYKYEHHLGEQIKDNEIGWAYRTCGREERCIPGFLCGNLKERSYLKEIPVDGK
jgi:hypothetical protein